MTATHATSAGEDLGERKQGADSRKRMSCNGCRVLRKGCSDTCILRPCLQWIESPEAQGHATVFVAKFFGRAGLMSFISAVPESQRPALFQSLLYEACGRTVNPVHGAVGLLWSGNWQVCQAAVETVLKGGILRPPLSSSSTMATCSTRPSLMNNTLSFRNSSRQEMEISKMRSSNEMANEIFTVKSGLDFPRLSCYTQPYPQQQSWMTGLKVKSEPLEASVRGTFVPEEAKIHPPISDMPGRRVRQRIHGNEATCNYSNHEYQSTELKFVGEFQADVMEVKANLDLTLNCDHSSSSQFNRRVSSPSIVSVNSEGSVTSLESGSLPLTDQKTMAAKEQKVLDLFP